MTSKRPSKFGMRENSQSGDGEILELEDQQNGYVGAVGGMIGKNSTRILARHQQDSQGGKSSSSGSSSSGQLDQFDSILPRTVEVENTVYKNVSQTLGATVAAACSLDRSKESMADSSLSSMGEGNSPLDVSCSGNNRKTVKVCEVCGDKAKSFHFGGVSCDSCKAFFRRAVHNDSHNSFRCAYEETCEITVATRKTCQACRFKRCTQIGMEKKWVMNEDERNAFQKQRQEKKHKKAKPQPTDSGSGNQTTEVLSSKPSTGYDPDVADMLKYLTEEAQNEIETLVMKFHQSYIDIPYEVSHGSQERNSIEIIQMFTTILRRMVYFHKNLSNFGRLSQEDQSTLLRQGVLEMCMLRSALTYDFKNNRWPLQTGSMEFLRTVPVLRVEDMKKLVSPDLYDMQMRFISGIQELQADEPVVTLLSLIVLFSPDRNGLVDTTTVSQVQDRYLTYLKNYIQWRFGPNGSKMYPKFLAKLSDLRQLNDSHNEYNLRLAQREVNHIQEQLSSINLNPYTQWDLVKCDKSELVGSPEPGASPLNNTVPSENQDEMPREPHRHPQQHHRHHHHHHHPSPEEQPSVIISTNSHPQRPPNNATATYQISPPPPPSSVPSSSSFQPSMAGILFSQMVNRQIPILIEDPMASISAEQDIANMSRFFAPRGASKLAKLGQTNNFIPTVTQSNEPPASRTSSSTAPTAVYEQPLFQAAESSDNSSYAGNAAQQSHPGEYSSSIHQQQQTPKTYSTLKNILESIGEIKDPNFLQQVKQSLSPEVLKQLRDTFAPLADPNDSIQAQLPSFPLSSMVPSIPASCFSSSGGGLSNGDADGAGLEYSYDPQSGALISDQIQDILQSFGYQEQPGEELQYYEHPSGGVALVPTYQHISYTQSSPAVATAAAAAAANYETYTHSVPTPIPNFAENYNHIAPGTQEAFQHFLVSQAQQCLPREPPLEESPAKEQQFSEQEPRKSQAKESYPW